MGKTKEGDIVDRLVAWGCGLLHLDRHTKVFQQLAKFFIVGCTNTLINWAISFSLYLIPNFSPLWANTIAFAISTIFNFWASTTWVFDTTGKKTKKRLFIEFAVFNGLSFLMFDIGLYAVLYYNLHWHKVISKVITTAFGMVFNFITRKLFLEDNNKLKETLRSRRIASGSRGVDDSRKGDKPNVP